MSLKYVQCRKTTLAVPLTDTETSSIVLRDLLDSYGNQLTYTDFGDLGYMTIAPGTDNEEIVSFGGFTVESNGNVTIDTSITRALLGVSPYGTGGTAHNHAAGTEVVFSNNPQMYEALKDYVDSVAIAGAADASATGKGIVEIAVLSEIDADTRLGSTGAVLAVAPDVLATSKYGVIVSAFTGVILPYAGTSAPTGFLLCDGSAVSRTTYADLYAITGDAYGAGDGSTTFNVPDLRSSFPLGGGTARTRVMTFDGASAVDPATDTITVTSNDWLHTGQTVALTGSSLPAGLSAGTYYVIRTSETAIKLASSVANANAGTAVDITADGSGTCTLTQTLTARTVGATGGEQTHALTDAEMPSHVHTQVAVANTMDSGTGSSNVAPGDSGSNTGSAGSDTPHNIMPVYTVVSYIVKY